MTGRLPGLIRLLPPVAGWALIAVGLRVDLWLGVLVAVLIVAVWLWLLRRAASPRRTWFESIVQISVWAALSLLTWVALWILFIVVATFGSGLGLWGSPWDGR